MGGSGYLFISGFVIAGQITSWDYQGEVCTSAAATS
jgi:hypothetical protein